MHNHFKQQLFTQAIYLHIMNKYLQTLFLAKSKSNLDNSNRVRPQSYFGKNLKIFSNYFLTASSLFTGHKQSLQ